MLTHLRCRFRNAVISFMRAARNLRRRHFRSDHIAFFDIFVAIFFIQNHDVRKRPDNQRLLPPAADSGTRAALRASRFALRRCRFPLAIALRVSLIEIANARQAQ